MVDDSLDELDRRILHLLQVDARGATDTDIAEDTDVTGTTVSNRIKKLEEIGVIRGYHPEIDYEQAGYPLEVLFICSVDLSDRAELAEEVLTIRGVVNVRELLAGEENIHVQIVANSIDGVEGITEQLNEVGLRVVSSTILANEAVQPWNHFHHADVGQRENETDTQGAGSDTQGTGGDTQGTGGDTQEAERDTELTKTDADTDSSEE